MWDQGGARTRAGTQPVGRTGHKGSIGEAGGALSVRITRNTIDTDPTVGENTTVISNPTSTLWDYAECNRI